MLIFMMPFPQTASVEENTENPTTLDQVDIERYGLFLEYSPFIDQEKLDQLMDSLEASVYEKPVDAKLHWSGKIIKEIQGSALDRHAFEISFREYYYGLRSGEMEVPKRPLYPKIDEGLLKTISSKKLGSYSTFYNESNNERSNNIALAADTINSTVLFPGDTFSFNQTVGERTKERGYMMAPVIVRGELSEDIGGGICQVSSTLFNAAELKGIQIIERYAHSKKVPYVPPGRDAAVSWWGPDLVFRNLYNEPILIRSHATHGIMSVSIYSSETAEYFQGDRNGG